MKNKEFKTNFRELTELENIIGYTFNDKKLFELALTHSSYANDYKTEKVNNERLEFLGDAVLELASSEALYTRYPQKPEGELTRFRASIVCEPTLASCAREIELGSFLRIGKGEDRNGGRDRDSIVSDAFEALIGAIYLDGGLANAKDFVERFVLNDVESRHLFYDSKTILQELVQKHFKERVEYELVEENGPDHDKIFSVQAVFNGDVIGRGSGKTKKRAEQEAAYEALLLMKKKNS